MKRSTLLSTAIICVLSQSVITNADAAGSWYVGAGIGSSKTNAGATELHPNLVTDYAPTSTSVEKNGKLSFGILLKNLPYLTLVSIHFLHHKDQIVHHECCQQG